VESQKPAKSRFATFSVHQPLGNPPNGRRDSPDFQSSSDKGGWKSGKIKTRFPTFTEPRFSLGNQTNHRAPAIASTAAAFYVAMVAPFSSALVVNFCWQELPQILLTEAPNT
jgi:hypothetical protein